MMFLESNLSLKYNYILEKYSLRLRISFISLKRIWFELCPFGSTKLVWSLSREQEMILSPN